MSRRSKKRRKSGPRPPTGTRTEASVTTEEQAPTQTAEARRRAPKKQVPPPEPKAVLSTPGTARRHTALCVLRLALAALFLFSGWAKLQDPVFFAFALRDLRLDLSPKILSFLAFALPWTETLAGLLLLAGAWTRPAAAVVIFLMAAFSAGILSLVFRGLEVSCPCFGASELICTGPLGACHLLRNLIIAALAAVLVARGGGMLSLDTRSRPLFGVRPRR